MFLLGEKFNEKIITEYRFLLKILSLFIPL